MKTRVFVALLLVFALVATSAVTAFADPEPNPVAEVTNFADLQTALADGAITEVRVIGNFTIDADLTIAKPVLVGRDGNDRFTVTVANNTTVTINDGGQFGVEWHSPDSKLINNGTVVINADGEGAFTDNFGTMTVHGKQQAGLTNHTNATITVDGNLSTTQGGDIVNQGTVTIQEGALLSCIMGAGFINEAGATLNIDYARIENSVCLGYEEYDGYKDMRCFFKVHNDSTVNCENEFMLAEAEFLMNGMTQEQYHNAVNTVFGNKAVFAPDIAHFIVYHAAGNAYQLVIDIDGNYNKRHGDTFLLTGQLIGSAYTGASFKIRLPEYVEVTDATPVDGNHCITVTPAARGEVGSTNLGPYHLRINAPDITEVAQDLRFEILDVDMTPSGSVRTIDVSCSVYPDELTVNDGNKDELGHADASASYVIDSHITIDDSCVWNPEWDAPITIRDGGELRINGVEINMYANLTIEEGGRLVIDGYSTGDWEHGDYELHQGKLVFQQSEEPGAPNPTLTNNGEIEVGHDQQHDQDEFGQLYLVFNSTYTGNGNINTHCAPVFVVCDYDGNLVFPYASEPNGNYDRRIMLLVDNDPLFAWALNNEDISRIIVLGDVRLIYDDHDQPYVYANHYQIRQYVDVDVEHGTLQIDTNVQLDVNGTLGIGNEGELNALGGSRLNVNHPENDDFSQGQLRIFGDATLDCELNNYQSVEIGDECDVTIGGEFTSEGNLSIYGRPTVTVENGATLNINGETGIHDETSLVVDGTVNFNCEQRLEIHGRSSLEINGTFTVIRGEVEMCDENQLDINGTLNIGVDGEDNWTLFRVRNLDVNVPTGGAINIYDGQLDVDDDVEIHVSGTIHNDGAINLRDNTRIFLENSAVFNNYRYFELRGSLEIGSQARFNNHDSLWITDRGSIDQSGVLYNYYELVNYGDYFVHGGDARIYNDRGFLYVNDSATWAETGGYHSIQFGACEPEDVIVEEHASMMFFNEGFDGNNLVYRPWGAVINDVKGAMRSAVLCVGHDYFGGWQPLTRDQVELEYADDTSASPDDDYVFITGSEDPEDERGYDIRFNDWGRGGLTVTVAGNPDSPFHLGLATELPWNYFFYEENYDEAVAVTNYETICVGDGEVWYMNRYGFDDRLNIEITVHAGGDNYVYHYEEDNDRIQSGRWMSQLDDHYNDEAVSDYLDFALVNRNGEVYEDGRRPYDIVIKFANEIPDTDFEVDVDVNGGWNRLRCQKPLLIVDGGISYMDNEDHVAEVNVRLERNPGFAAFAFLLRYDTAKLDLTQVTSNYYDFNPENLSVREVPEGAIIEFHADHDIYLDDNDPVPAGIMFNVKFDVLDREDKGFGEFTDDMAVTVEYYNPEGGSFEDFTNARYQNICPEIYNDGAVQTYRWGDVWRTNRVDVKDAVRMLQFINHMVDLSEAELRAGDITHDGNVNVSDLTKLLRYLVGLDTNLAQAQ